MDYHCLMKMLNGVTNSRLQPRAAMKAACVALLASALVGCGSNRDGLVEVSGVVTMDGEPLTTGRVEFFPDSGRPASGQIDSEGRYQLSTYEKGDGAKPGNYVVTVTSRIVPDEGVSYKSMEDELRGVQSGSRAPSGPAKVKWLAPQKYSNRTTSDLTAEVSDGGAEIDLNLQSKS
ncbi:hypothetical protein KOR34_02580 [Posidoniimonas corsicana]|uniref:Carboxypeptidase regulatory-like domain-containing protein n=2 Tax=Posidoniimonas corsicana TaxID=1938618 RepID=A0A5C5VBM2_9BACT|nr:hypothetical protein KOR34_02580 [Posidoniimonas corsicana]